MEINFCFMSINGVQFNPLMERMLETQERKRERKLIVNSSNLHLFFKRDRGEREMMKEKRKGRRKKILKRKSTQYIKII